jgi:putative colanic acid biosynthesis acetyltransferase WcaF
MSNRSNNNEAPRREPSSDSKLVAMPCLTVRQHPGAADRMRRRIWFLVWAVLYRPTPTILFAWRRALLRLFGARVGAGAHPYPSARIWAPWNLVMGEGSCLADGVDCYSVDRVVLGRNVVVSRRAFLCTASHDHLHPGFRLATAPFVIEEEEWVAAEAFFGPGVRIGRGAVAGARAVVIRHVLPSTVVAGNPARAVGQRRAAKTDHLG